jgi:hypothetical protein
MRAFRCAHTCGHRETHRITMLEPEPHEPTDQELQDILAEYQSRPCNACLVGLPAGARFNSMHLLPRRGMTQ